MPAAVVSMTPQVLPLPDGMAGGDVFNGEVTLQTVGQISHALTPYLGRAGGTVLFGLGMLGAALVAAIVASLAGAWGLAEVFGWRHTLNERPDRATASSRSRRCGSSSGRSAFTSRISSGSRSSSGSGSFHPGPRRRTKGDGTLG